MQKDKTLQQLITQYEAEMPPEIMNIIKGFDWKRQVRMIVNQNQLLLDVGADLEESVYLMILGIVDVEAVFDRMMTAHELPQDKVQKILSEVEKQIFEPMHAQLAKLEPLEDKAKPASSPVAAPTTPFAQPPAPEPKKESTAHIVSQSSGIRESFSIKDTKETMDTQDKDDDIKIDVDAMGTLDPVAMNLNRATVSTPEPMPVLEKKEENSPVEKKYAVDPYREPIE